MRNPLFPFLHQKRFFWKARAAFSRLRFVVNRTLFGMKHRAREEGTAVKSLGSLGKSALRDLVPAIFIATVLQLTNAFFVPLFTKIGFTIPQESDYGSLLAAVIGVGGAFIGLYYAAISLVCGAIYKEVPNNILGLLTQEQVGRTYMRFLAWLTCLSVCLLVFHVAGCEQVILAMPLFLFSAGVAIIGFVILGTRAFFLFDPQILSDTLFERLRQCYTQVQSGGFRWLDPSFQKQAHETAQATIDTLATLSEIAANGPHLNGRPFAGLCKNLFAFLRNYEQAKKAIPTDSLWYRQRYTHPEWYRARDLETSVAYQTAAILQPKSVSDPRWIESAILPIVNRCLEINLKNKRYDIVHELIERFDVYVQGLAAEHQVEFAFQVLRDVFSQCEALLFVQADDLVEEEPLEHLGICEQLATMPIQILLVYTRAVESYGRAAILQRTREITWKSEKSIYSTGFAVHVLERLEWLRPRVEFEKRVEGHRVSPFWYLQELITQMEAKNLSATTICFHNEACKFYGHWIEKARTSLHPWLAAAIMSREWEYWDKLNHHTNALKQLWDDFNSERQIEGIRWPRLDINALTEKRELREKELLTLMSEENLLLSFISRPASYPDFAGQFLHTVGEALIFAMYRNDCDMVEILFKRYYGGCRLQFDRLRPKEVQVDPLNLVDLKIAAAPLLDLMDMSGYAYLLSDYHDTPRLRDLVITVWDEYLSLNSDSSPLPSFAAAVVLTESGVEREPRGVNRTRWKQMIADWLEDVERQERGIHGGYGIGGSETIGIHNSPLVRIFAISGFLPYDGIDIFIAKYLRQRENGQNLDFGSGRRTREEEIKREENRNTTEPDHETEIQ